MSTSTSNPAAHGGATAGMESPASSAVSKFSLPALTAMVVGSMVGAGVFSLPARFGVATGVLGSLIAWAVAGTGMLMLAFVFQNLAIRKPELDSGVYIYAKAGFGDYVGFNSAIGFWASAVAGNTFYWVFMSATIGSFTEAFGDGDTFLAVAVSSVGVWLFHYLVARGVKDAAAINQIVTVCKIVPIGVFIVVLLLSLDTHVFSLNWLATGYGLGNLNQQVRNTMIITTFVFIGVEGASVYSRYARRREDVGRATVLGFLSVLALFALVTLASYSVAPQPEIAATRQPSMVGIFESQVGHWGQIFISVGIIISVMGAYLAWTLMAAEVMYNPARARDMPRFLGQENDKQVPITALVATSLGIQALLGLTLFVTNALDFMLDFSTALSLLPYLLAAAYALKLGLTGEAYETVSAGVRRRETIVAGAATGYTLFLFDAAGPTFVLLSTLILAPATLLYVKARGELNRRIFSPAEIGLLVLILAGAAAGVVALWTGRIVL